MKFIREAIRINRHFSLSVPIVWQNWWVGGTSYSLWEFEDHVQSRDLSSHLRISWYFIQYGAWFFARDEHSNLLCLSARLHRAARTLLMHKTNCSPWRIKGSIPEKNASNSIVECRACSHWIGSVGVWCWKLVWQAFHDYAKKVVVEDKEFRLDYQISTRSR